MSAPATSRFIQTKIEVVETEQGESDNYVNDIPETAITPKIVSVGTLNSVGTPSTRYVSVFILIINIVVVVV